MNQDTAQTINNQKPCHCPPVNRKKSAKGVWPLLSGLFIAIIPKCSFCVLAYSSAITLCSGKQVYDHAPQWTSYISVGLAVLTLFFILINYKGWRTILATVLVLIGSGIILRAELITGQLDNYYLGVFVLLLGVWMNASFYYFMKKWLNAAHSLVLKK
jgi:xanthine/uracil permease